MIALVTCPWYKSTQPERGQQAKHNCLLVVFTSKNEHFFAPVNSHQKSEAEVIDKVFKMQVCHVTTLICYSIK